MAERCVMRGLVAPDAGELADGRAQQFGIGVAMPVIAMGDEYGARRAVEPGAIFPVACQFARHGNGADQFAVDEGVHIGIEGFAQRAGQLAAGHGGEDDGGRQAAIAAMVAQDGGKGLRTGAVGEHRNDLRLVLAAMQALQRGVQMGAAIGAEDHRGAAGGLEAGHRQRVLQVVAGDHEHDGSGAIDGAQAWPVQDHGGGIG